jgi:hypothetical protein
LYPNLVGESPEETSAYLQLQHQPVKIKEENVPLLMNLKQVESIVFQGIEN